MTPWRAAAIPNLSVMTNNLLDQVEKKIGGFIFIFTVAKTDFYVDEILAKLYLN